jgi:hypothetical protein
MPPPLTSARAATRARGQKQSPREKVRREKQIDPCSNLLGKQGEEKMRGLSQRTLELIVFARMLLAEFHPMTLRQLHYAIFSAAKIEYDNTPSDYKRLSRATTTARRGYRELELAGYKDLLNLRDGIPPDWIVDETRQAEVVNVWADVHGYLDTVKRAYRRDNWQTQPHYCEVWSEKATVLGSLRPLADELGVTLRVCRGYGSTGMESRIGEDFEVIDRPITVFFLGDHDPSGRDIERDIHRRAQDASGKEFKLIRLAIHPEDIRLFKLPPQKIKDTDSRADAFKAKYGNKAATVELDALPVDELRRRVREAIESLIDFDRWNRQVRTQQLEFACINDFVERVKNLPQIG